MPGPRDGVLFQEYLTEEDPSGFWMLVACQLVNLTTWAQAKPAFRFIRSLSECAAPHDRLRMALTLPEELEECLRPLGLWRRRSRMLPRFASAWLASPPVTAEDIQRLPGCGKYAADSWAIFIERRFDVEPRDGKLAWYLDRVKADGRNPARDHGGSPPGS